MKHLDKKSLKTRGNPHLRSARDKKFFWMLVKLVLREPVGYYRILLSESPARSNTPRWKKEIIAKRKEILQWIFKKTKCLDDGPIEYFIGTRLNWIFTGRTSFNVCKGVGCGNLIWKDKNISPYASYPTFCSAKCISSHPDTIAKAKKKTELLHGDPNFRNGVQTRATCLKRYGKTSFSKTKHFKEQMKSQVASMKAKEIATKKQRKSLNTSRAEDKCYELLLQVFSKSDICREHKSERYPFYCDFYIKSQDLFIEFNGHWTHGRFPYKEHDLKCKKQLALWKRRSRESNFFKNAITTWTVRDVKKRNIAKSNKLNYREVWTLDEFRALVERLKKRHGHNNHHR